MGVNWVLNGLNRCFGHSIGHSIGPFGPKQTQSRPFGLIRPPKTRWLVDFAGVGVKKKALILTNRGLLNFMNRICIEKCNIISLFRCKFNHTFYFQQIFFEKKCVKRRDGQFFSEIHQFTERIHYLCIAKISSIVPFCLCFEIFGIYFFGRHGFLVRILLYQ